MENERLKGLSLFSGVAGLELGLTEWVKTEQYVEIDKYAQAVLRSRMEAGDIDTAHIHDDIKTFKAEKGKFDIITGGFPCVDISNAGKREGIHAERSGLWFEMQRLVSELRPRYLFVENVSAILGRGLDEVLGSLSEIGYDAVWTTLRASDVGAPHRRERWFMLAYPDYLRCGTGSNNQREHQIYQEGQSNTKVKQQWKGFRSEFGESDSIIPNTHSEGLERLNSKEAGTGQPKTSVRLRGRDVWRQDPADLDPSSLTDLGRMAYGTSSPLDGSKWGYTPRVYRNSKNSFRIKRLKCLGNAVVPQQAREAFIRLMQIKEELKK